MHSAKSSITQLIKLEVVEFIRNEVFTTYSNTYISIGRPIRWGDELDPEEYDEIEDVEYTTNYRNQIYRDMIAIKKVQAADIALVVPRVDWKVDTIYDQYSDSVEIFSHERKLNVGTVDATGTTITQNTAIITGNISVGNTVFVGNESREVVAVGATTLTLNTALSGTYANASLTRTDNTYPFFANTFYVRNSKDQVFECLFNNNNSPSTIEPTIDIDGQLPENPYIMTGDDYKWKYLYTIPYGVKQKFFTKNWMPVLIEPSVVAGSVNGRIDTVDILNGGTGYFLNNGESGNVASLNIITITGDGEGAEITAKIESGVITELNILDGGSGYTTAELTVFDTDQLANGTPAVLKASIPPYGGHGANPVKELGCYTVMTTVELEGSESDTIPVGSLTSEFDFRQITMLRDPLLTDGSYANGSVYSTTTKLQLTDPGVTDYSNDETVYIGSSLAEATFTATVVNWNKSTNELFVNNMTGVASVGEGITGQDSAAVSTVLGVTQPNIRLFSGDLLYIENRDKIIRDVDQTEQIRLVLSF